MTLLNESLTLLLQADKAHPAPNANGDAAPAVGRRLSKRQMEKAPEGGSGSLKSRVNGNGSGGGAGPAPVESRFAEQL